MVGSSGGRANVFRTALVLVAVLAVVHVGDVLAAKKKERPDAITEAVGILQSAKAAGQGSRENQRALVALTGSGERALLPILEGFEKATPEGLNWLRNAFEQIADAQRASRKALPLRRWDTPSDCVGASAERPLRLKLRISPSSALLKRLEISPRASVKGLPCSAVRMRARSS